MLPLQLFQENFTNYGNKSWTFNWIYVYWLKFDCKTFIVFGFLKFGVSYFVFGLLTQKTTTKRSWKGNLIVNVIACTLIPALARAMPIPHHHYHPIYRLPALRVKRPMFVDFGLNLNIDIHHSFSGFDCWHFCWLITHVNQRFQPGNDILSIFVSIHEK